MAAAKGNKLWQLRQTHGRKRKFQTPGDLWRGACEYFAWIDQNPLLEQVLVTNRGAYKCVDVPKMRPYTQAGLCIFLGITQQTYTTNYRNRPEYTEVIDAIDSIMFEQKFSGAAAGFFNAQIIGRELGLAEKTEVTGANGAPMEWTFKVVKPGNH